MSLNNANAQFKHIAILLRAVAKSSHANANEMKRKIKTGHNNTYTQYPSGYGSVALISLHCKDITEF